MTLTRDPDKLRAWQRRSKRLASGKGLSAMSPRRKARRQERSDAVATAARRDHHECQAQYVWPHRCWGPLVGHEPRKRSQGGDQYDPDQILTVCAGVNGLVEEEPEWARTVGLAVRGSETWSWLRDWRVG